MKLKVILSCALVAFLALQQACKKVDVNVSQPASNEEKAIEAKFFTVPAGTSDLTRRVIEEIKQRNEKSRFVAEFATTNGYPVWNKALQLEKPNNNPSSVMANSTSNSGANDSILFIPIVPNGQNKVVGFVKAVINNSVNLSYSMENFYKNYPTIATNEVTAKEFAQTLMYLNFQTFGHTDFNITDKRLFHLGNNYNDTANITRHVTISADTTFQNAITSICVTTTVTTITQNWHCTNTGNCASGVCDLCSLCIDVDISQTSETNCLNTNVGGSPPPSGGGSGGSGNIPPYYPCTNGPTNPPVVLPVVSPVNNVGSGPGLPPCPPPGPGTGWNPTPPVPPNSPPPSDSIPNQLSRRVSRELDSLYLWGMNNGYREQSFIIVKNNATGAVYPKNFMPGFPTGDKTRVNYTLGAGEQLLAYVHTHAEDTSGYYRTSFSPEDLIEFNKNAVSVGYTAILEIGNARYAFVLEDIGKKNTFNVQKRGVLKSEFYNKLQTKLNSGLRGTAAMDAAWIELLGSASSNGIGLYKSQIPSKNSFIKLNP
jgi:hypothetical protein